MSLNYVPRKGSIPDRVIKHLEEHGGSLLGSEIAKMYGGGGKGIATQLHRAVDAGLLAIEKSGISYVYSLPQPISTDGELQIASYSDGDVSVSGGTPLEDGGVMYTKAQIEQLVRHVSLPHVSLNP
jgi:hypothetical protein